MMNIIIKAKACLQKIFVRNKTEVKTTVEVSEVSDSAECEVQPLHIEIEPGSQLILSTTEAVPGACSYGTSEINDSVIEMKTETDATLISTTENNSPIPVDNKTANIESESSLVFEGTSKPPRSIIDVYVNRKKLIAPRCDAIQPVSAPTLSTPVFPRPTQKTVSIFIMSECDSSVNDKSQMEKPVDSPCTDDSKLIILKEEKISKEAAEKLIKQRLLIKMNNGKKGYYVNPLLASFFHITDVDTLNALEKFDDENMRMYIEVARCFHFENDGELVFDGDGKMGMLEAYQSRTSKQYEYCAERLVQETYGKDVYFKSLETQTDEKWGKYDLLTLNVRSSSARCPVCGQTTTDKVKESGSSSRLAQDIPIRIDRPLMVEIRGLRQYRCQNPDCPKCRDKEAFIEQPDCLRPNQQRTKRLDALLLVCVIDSSFHGCERVMSLFGIKVGDDSIRKIIKNLVFPDDPDVTEIGVDDVADRKGVSYFTVIYAVKDHRMLALLDGRDGVELEKWLEHHLSVRLICRDRASAYAKHIDEWALRHNVEVKQIADRFHLIKNYIDHLRDICYSYLPKRIAFDKETGKILESVPNKIAQAVVPKPDVEELEKLNYDNSPVLNENGEPISITLSARPSSSNEDDEDSTDKVSEAADVSNTGRKKARNLSKAEKEAQEKRDKRYEDVRKIREEFDPAKGKMEQYAELGLKYKVCPMTVRKYIAMSQEEVELLKSPRHREKGPLPKEIDKYKFIIYKMLRDGYDIGVVFWYIKGKDYDKSDSNLLNYILDIYKIVFPNHVQPRIGKYIKLDYPDTVEVLTRSAILKYLVTVNPKTPKNQYLASHEKEFLEKYPKAKLMRDAFLQFHGVIMGNSVEDLEKLCNKPCALPELEAFFKHLLNEDMDAVSNAIRFSYSSGFVEGNNLRLKTIKRASYGRMRLSMLVQKCMIAFRSTLDDFELGTIVDWIPLHQNSEYAEEELDNYLDTLFA